MAKDDIPEWVSNEIQNAKFGKPKNLKNSGYILEIYKDDNKIDVQLYDQVEDGRHIVTMDLSKGIDIGKLEKGIICEFKFAQLKSELSKKVSEYLAKEKEIEMNAIYQFELKSFDVIDADAAAAPEK